MVRGDELEIGQMRQFMNRQIIVTSWCLFSSCLCVCQTTTPSSTITSCRSRFVLSPTPPSRVASSLIQKQPNILDSVEICFLAVIRLEDRYRSCFYGKYEANTGRRLA